MRQQGREVPIHRLRANETVWTPPSVVYLDTETRWETDGTNEVHTLRTWVAHLRDRRRPEGRPLRQMWGDGQTAGALAAWLDNALRGRNTCWLYAHNVGFDVTVTGLPWVLRQHGWAIGDFSVRGDCPWFRFRKGRQVLTVCDSWGWLQQSLAGAGERAGLFKVDLPDNDDGQTEWLARCRRDVEILATLMGDLMDWWDANELGRWTISGAGCGWNAFRHIPSPERHVIDVEPARVAQDRLAVRGGSKDAQVVRSATGGPWVELDLVQAYATVAATLPLPVRRAWDFKWLPVDSKWLRSDRFGALAECVIDTDRPCYPVKHDGVTWHPVGRFRTHLAAPEMLAAANAGHLVEIGQGQMHQLGWALGPWATWVLDPTKQGTVTVPAVARQVIKSWGRSVPGKMAAHAHSVEPMPGPATPGWSIREGWDGRVKRPGAEVQMAGQAYWVTYDGDTENCYPAVLAWVESHVRTRLRAVLAALGPAWWTCDTDGLILDLGAIDADLWRPAAILAGQPTDALGVAQGLCDALAPLVAPLVIRPKRVIGSLAVLGPQHLTVNGEHRYSGVAKDAKEVSPGRFQVRDWPGMAWQIANGRPNAYVRPQREPRFRTPTCHRWVMVDGEALPVEMAPAADGSNRLLPWAETRWRTEGCRLAEVQYPRLQRLT